MDTPESMPPLWSAATDHGAFAPLQGTASADVAVIGAGWKARRCMISKGWRGVKR